MMRKKRERERDEGKRKGGRQKMRESGMTK